MVRVGLSALLADSDLVELVGTANTAASAVEAARRMLPDVVLMDLRLPDDSGVVACREILSERPDVRVIFLSAYEDDLAATAALFGGAAGYLVKNLGHDSLLQAIKSAADGQVVFDGQTTPESVSAQIREAVDTPGRRQSDLSPQERRVLELVVQGKTNRQIGEEMNLSTKTVKNYLSNAFQKLHVGRRAHAAALFSRSLAGPDLE